MQSRFGRLSNKRVLLQNRFIEHLGNNVEVVSDVKLWPLLIRLKKMNISLAVYLFPNTNPPGGRRSGEYKFQLKVPNSKSGGRYDFDYTLGLPLLISYTALYDVYIIYDANRHTNFAWSSNVQSRVEFISKACIDGMAITNKSNNEKLIGVTSEKLFDGIKEWLKT